MNKKPTQVSKTFILFFFAAFLSNSPIFSQEHSFQTTIDAIINEIIGLKSINQIELTKSVVSNSKYKHIVTNSANHTYDSSEASESNSEIRARWITYRNEKGAFVVKLPEEPTDISRESPNPLDEDGEPYRLNMYASNDKKNEDIYIVRYNDMPNGYYLNDRQAGFSSIEDNLEGKATLIGEPKETKLGNIDGREIEIMIQGKYHAFMRIYIRGNRIYVLMAQKMNTTEKMPIDNEFFNSFNFEPYNYIQPTKYQPSPNEFEVSLFGNVKVTTDSVGYESTTIKQSTNHYSVNPSTGGLYQLNHGDLQDYVQIKNLKTFYEDHIQLYLEYNDSIIARKDVTVDGEQGMMFTLENKYSKMPERHQIWLDNNRLFVMTAYLSKEERENPISDLVFGSFKYDSSKDQPFDILSSKTDYILKDLHSTDTLVIQRALGAFDYYKFESKDLPKLYQSLKESYKDSLYNNVIKEVVISTFSSLHDENTIGILETLYKTTLKDDEELKSAVITIIPTIKENNALEVYKTLMQQSPPKTSENYNWQILSPFRDSIPFALDNFKLLTSLMEHEMYRSSILNISTNLLNEDLDKRKKIIGEKNSLLKFAKNDLDVYVKSLNDTLVNQYEYSSLMYAYLSFMNKSAIDSPLTDEFTNKIISLENNNWYKNQAFTARIRSKQILDKPIVNQLMDSLYYRFEIMKAYHDAAQFQEVPEKYKQAESFAELSLHYNLSEDDYEPDSMQIMGEFEKDDQLYYAYKVKYNEGEEALNSYIVTVGPIKDVSKMTELELYDFYTEWEQLDYANWESQAKQLIPSTSEGED